MRRLVRGFMTFYGRNIQILIVFFWPFQNSHTNEKCFHDDGVEDYHAGVAL